MPRKHLVTESTLETALEEAEENDRDAEAIREMYVTPEEAIGKVYKKVLHWGHTFYEATEIDQENEELILEELFTEKEYRESFDEILTVPLIGATFEVSWIEAKVDDNWKRVSEYSTPRSFRGPSQPQNEEYDQTRLVTKTYQHGEQQFETWPIRIDRRTEKPEVAIDHENVQNAGILRELLNSIELPESFDLGGLQVGEIYADEHIVETEDGYEKEYEIVWWSIRSQFEPSRTRRLSPVKTLDRKMTI